MLDAGALDRLCASVGAENLVDVLDQVLRSAAQACADLREQAARGDVVQVAEVAHRVKSDCAYMGEMRLVQRLADLETRVRGGARENILSEVPALLDALARFLDEVRSERAARARPA